MFGHIKYISFFRMTLITFHLRFLLKKTGRQKLGFKNWEANTLEYKVAEDWNFNADSCNRFLFEPNVVPCIGWNNTRHSNIWNRMSELLPSYNSARMFDPSLQFLWVAIVRFASELIPKCFWHELCQHRQNKGVYNPPLLSLGRSPGCSLFSLQNLYCPYFFLWRPAKPSLGILDLPVTYFSKRVLCSSVNPSIAAQNNSMTGFKLL